MPFYQINKEKNRVEMFYEYIPSYSKRGFLKSNGWWWDPDDKCWWNGLNETSISFAASQGTKMVIPKQNSLKPKLEIFEEGICGKKCKWKLSRCGQLIISGIGEIEGIEYARLNNSPWHKYAHLVKRVEIQEGITIVGKRAFYKFPYLESVSLPSTLISIDDRAFSQCAKLKDINLPPKLKNIGMQAFRDCIAISEIHIPYSVVELGEDCFKNWSLNQKIYRLQKNMHTGKIEETIILLKKSGAEAVQEIYFEDFVTVTFNNYCVNKGHYFENIQAKVNILQRDGNLLTITIPAGYCQTCKKYFIGYWQFEKIKKMGVLLCRMTHEESNSHDDTTGFYDDLSPESILKQYGYSVNANNNLTEEQRQQLLICLMESGICTKQKIASHLTWLIKTRSNQADLVNAISKWKADRDFVDSYKMGTGRVVGMRALRIRR